MTEEDDERMKLARRLGAQADKLVEKLGINPSQSSIAAIEIARWMRPKMKDLLMAHVGHGMGVPMHHRDDGSISNIKTRRALMRRNLIRLAKQRRVTVLTPTGKQMVDRILHTRQRMQELIGVGS